MTKQIIYILIIFTSLTLQLQGQSLNEILQKHFETVGIEELNKVKTIQYEGYKLNHFVKHKPPI